MSDLKPIDRDYLLQELQEQLPNPVREETQLDGDVVLVGGDPGEVIVRINGNKVSIAVFSIRWDGPHTPTVRPKQLATLNWKRLPASTTMMTLHGLISAAIEIRRSKYRKCENAKKQSRLSGCTAKTSANPAPNDIWGLCIEYRFNNSSSRSCSQTNKDCSLETFSTSSPPQQRLWPCC